MAAVEHLTETRAPQTARLTTDLRHRPRDTAPTAPDERLLRTAADADLTEHP